MALSEAMRKRINQNIEKKTTGGGSSVPVGSSAKETSAKGSTSLSSTMLDRIHKNVALKRLGREDTGVDEDFIKKFQNDYQKYVYDSQYDWKNMTYKSTRDGAASTKRAEKERDLSERAAAIRTYLDINKGSIDPESFKSMTAYLDQFDTNRATIKHEFSAAQKFYDSFETEEDYLKWDAYQTPEGRKARYANNQARIDELKEERKKISGGGNTLLRLALHNAGAISTEEFLAGNQRAKEIDKEIAAIESEMRMYERGNTDESGFYYGSKVVDDYGEYAEREDFGAVSSNRNFRNADRDALAEYDAMADSTTWYTDANNNIYDAFGNRIDPSNTDEKGNILHPLSGSSKYAVTDRLGLYLSASDADKQEALGTPIGTEGTWESIIKDGYDGNWELLEKDEVDVYYYLLNNSGQETADKYLSDMKTELNRRNMQQETTLYTEKFAEADTLERIALSIATTPAQMISGAAGFIEDAAMTAMGKDINPYSAAHGGMNFSQTVRSEQAEAWDEATGGAKIPFINFTAGDLYQAGMSAFDTAVGGKLGAGAYEVLMGMGAASTEARRLYEQGASKEQIAWGGALAGGAEIVFEHASIDSLINLKDADTVGQFVKNLLIQGGIEATEEGFTDIANTITNAIVMGSESDWAKLVEEHGGDRLAAFVAKVQDVGKAAFGGFVSGSMGGAGHSAASYAQVQAQNAELGQYISGADSTDALVALAQEMARSASGRDQKRLTAQSERIGKDFLTEGGKNRATGRLYNTVRSAVTEQNVSEISSALQEKGISKKDATAIASAFAEQANGAELSDKQQKVLDKFKSNEEVQGVLNEILDNQESGINQRAKSVAKFEFGAMRNHIISQMEQSMAEQENATEVDKVDTPKENVPESRYEVSAEGKTILKSTGDIVTIKEVADTKNGKMILRLQDGSTVSAEDVSFGSAGEALIYETVAQMGASVKAANILVNGFKAAQGDTMSAQVYAHGISEAFRYGKLGIPMRELANSDFASKLNKGQQEYVYRQGQKAAGQQTAKDQATVNRAVQEAKNSSETAESRSYQASLEDGISVSDLNESQKASYQLADQVAQAAKVNVRVYVSKTGEHGYYNYDTDEIYLNLNATNKSRKSMMAFTLGHELVHRAKKGSPAKYEAFANFLMEQYGKQGANVEDMIAQELAAAKQFNVKMSYEKAFEEVVCDACQRMLLDTNAGQKLAEFGAQSKENKSFLEDLKRWIKEFMDKLRSIFEGVEPDSVAAQEFAKFDESVKQILADMYVDMTIDAGENLSTIQNAFGKGTVVETNEHGEFTMAQSADGSEKVFNLVTWNNGGRETLEATLLREGYTEEEVKAALTIMDEKQRLVESIANELNGNGQMAFPEQGRINEATLTTDLKDGHSVLSALVSNGDYPVNIDLLMVCKKRKAYQRVINRLCETGMIKEATVDALAIAEINKILGKYGFETACLGCFVESRRLRIQEWAQTIVKEWNAEVKKRNPNAKAFGFGKGETTLTPDEVMQLVGELESGGAKNDQGNLNLGQGSAVKRMGVLLDKVPSLRRTLSIEDLITPDGLSSLRSFDSNLFSMVKSRYGSNSPKFVQEFNPYNHELAKYGKVPSEYKSLREYLYAIGGARMQSFSDFIIENWFDYCQIVADLAARKLPMHTYTKEISLAKLFGLTGIKINMSLIPDVDKSLGKEYAGLTRNAKGELELIWADKDRYKATGGKSYMQSINFADAMELQNDPRYSANVGTIAVGISDMHIQTMLDDARIRMIIPYHSSGMNPIFADLMGTSYYKDYTNFQNTTVKQMYDSKGKKVSLKLDKTQTGKLTSGFQFNEVLQELGDARAAAEAYKEWCADASLHTITIKGETYTAELTPKFDDFSGHENYYKLLEDFNTYDCISEQAAPQGDVQQIYPEGFEDILRAELTGQERYRQKQEKNQAFDKAMADIEAYLKDHSKADTVHYAKQHGINLGAKDKKLNAAEKEKLKKLQEEGASFSLPKSESYQEPAYQEWDVQAALYDALDHADKGDENMILVGEMPRYITDKIGIEGDFYIYRNHAYENMVSKEQAIKDGRPITRKGETVHFHDLGVDRMTEAIMSLENPTMTIATKTKEGNPAIIMLLPVQGKNKAPLYAVLSFYSNRPINGDLSRKPHVILTIAERDFFGSKGRGGYAEIVGRAVQDGRVIDFNKEMRDDLSVIANPAGVGNITDSSLSDNLARFRKEIKAFREKNHIDYKLPVGEDTSPRALLSNAFETIVTNPIEKQKLQEYKENVAMLNAEEQKLHELRAQIKELSFAKGKRDTKKIYELRFDAKQTENRISTLDKMLLSFEASKPLQNILNREKEMVRKRAEQKNKEALAAYRERVAKTQRELLDRWQESRKKGIESRQSSYVRSKIKAFKARLESSLLSPTDRRYVPIDLVNAMVEVCGLIDTDADTGLYKADGSINKAQEKRNLTKEKLQNLKDEYEKLKTHSDPIYAGEFDEMVYAYLTELRDKYAGKNLKEMNLDELTEMYEILRAIEETLQDARKLIGWGDAEDVYEAGDAIVAEQSKITQSRKGGKRNAAQIARDKSLNLSLSPVRNVERMSGYHKNSYLLKLFKKFEQGIRKKNKFVMEAYKSFETLTASKEYEDAIYKEVGGKKYEDVNGRKFGISKMQMMQTILSYEREAANGMHHIENSGFSFADLDMLRKGKLRDAISEEYSHRVPAAVNLVAEFNEALKNDKWCQDYMAAARKFFNGTAKDAINETSIALKHRIIAKDKSYIPFEVDKNFVVREISAENDIQQTINSYGMLKDTKKGASQPLIITGLNNILDRHIDQVGNVYGLAIDVRNFNKVWNVRTIDDVGNDPTVKAAIQRNWGHEGVKHIEQAVQDIQGPRHSEQSALYKKAKSGYIGATFLLNLSVVTKQIGSLYSATSMLKWRGPVRQIGNLFYTMVNHKNISAEVDKYTATAWMRRQGLSDAELHTFMTEGKKSLVGKLVGKLPSVFNPGKWITAMDHAVALSLWRYAKIDTAKRTGLKGEELLKATAEFYDDVVENTQSMTDVLHRPEIQKRSDIISESFAMFKTDLYQMAGQLHVTAGRFTANKTKENGMALGRTVYAIAMSAVWAQLMTTVFALLRYKVKQYRDDEDEELTVESWMKRQGFSFVGDLMGYIFPIFGSELIGVFENIMYGESEEIVDSIALTAINDLYDVMITVGSSVKDGEMPKLEDMKKLTAKALQVFGVPANNILRTWEAIHLHAKDIANGKFLSFEAGVERSTKHHIHRIVEAMDEGKTDLAIGLYEEALEETAMDKADDGSYGNNELNDAKSDLKTALGNKFKDGEISEEKTIDILMKCFGSDRDEAEETVGKWAFKVEYGIAWNDRADAYLSGKISANELRAAIMDIEGKTKEKADEYIADLDFEAKHGFSYGDRGDAYMNGNISEYEMKAILIDIGGMTEEEADLQIQAYDWEAQGFEGTTMAAVREYNEYCAADNVPRDIYLHIRKFSNNTENDVDKETGKTIYYSAMKKVMAEIHAQRLTNAQKTAVARSLGWSEKNINKYKLW